jgi:hypothetical protein
MDPDDTPEAHVEDTLVAGAGLCHRVVVEICANEGPDRIRELVLRGAKFDTHEDGPLSLTREGGHSARRVVHAADATGAEVERALLERVAAHPNVRLGRAPHGHRPHHAVSLRRAGRCVRLRLDAAPARSPARPQRRDPPRHATVLATGGAGKVYLYTTNPDVATGDGVAMAYRAGAEIGNMEFYQFHPTCLYHPRAKSFLMTEALRGEGGDPSARRRHRVHGAARPPQRPRPSRHRGPRHRLRDEAHGLATTCCSTSRTSPRAFIQRALPHHPRRVPRSGIDITVRAHPGRAGGPLHVRRRQHRSARPHLDPGPLGDRGVRVHGPPRRQPPRLQLPPRRPRVRPPRREEARRASSPSCARARSRASPSGRPRRRDAERRGGRRHPQLGRAAPHHVELRRHRALGLAPAPRGRSIACCRRRSASTTGSTSSRGTCSSCATSPPWPS